jgi:hypothetical protein
MDKHTTPEKGAIIAVWFSCGAPSAVAAKRTLEIYGSTCDVRILNNIVDEEPADNRRFLKDVASWLNHPIENVANSELGHTSADKVWRSRSFMSGPKGAPCTGLLKKAARFEWQAIYQPDWHVFGFTSEEVHRHNRIVLTDAPNTLPVLIDLKISRNDCFNIIREDGLVLPKSYADGFPNANCMGCVKATSPSYWNLVRKVDPETFEARSKLSRELGAKLVRYAGKRIFLDELPADAKGRRLKSMPDCGILCDSKKNL